MVAKGNNNYGTAGVAYEAGLMRISHPMDTTQVSAPDASVDLAGGISWAWSMGADVINCSWGDKGGGVQGLHSTILEEAIDDALTWGRSGKGCVVVFSAGNYAPAMDYPGTYDDRIITVGSIGDTGVRSSFSGYGTKLDVVAPGENIMTSYIWNSVEPAYGTSFAAPHVSGIAALMISANPKLTGEEVTRIIEQTANKINPGLYLYGQYQNRYNGNRNQEVGYGLVDAARAVAIARDANLTPPASSPGLDYYVTTGVDTQSDNFIVMAYSQNAMLSFALKPAQINTAYTYYWHFTTSGDYGWRPYFTFVGNYNGVNMSIPRPSMDSVLTVSCEVYNGSTHVCTATKSLTVRLSFP
jgi:subtilisin family serine protease